MKNRSDMFRLTLEPSSGSKGQYLAKIPFVVWRCCPSESGQYYGGCWASTIFIVTRFIGIISHFIIQI